MEKNWHVIILVIIAVIALIGYLIYRNQKDKKDLMKTLIREDQVLIPKESDTEVDPSSEK
jgi:flagellar biosynthesis/type III secretory pathway M-ring protein FliF/YscJ